MPRHQTPAQQETVERVMHEFKHGELKTARGTRKVKDRKQAIAIALHEAGSSRNESPAENKRNLRRTKAKERRGETYRDEEEGEEPRSDGAEASRPPHHGAARFIPPRRAHQGRAVRRGQAPQHPGPVENGQDAAPRRWRPISVLHPGSRRRPGSRIGVASN